MVAWPLLIALKLVRSCRMQDLLMDLFKCLVKNCYKICLFVA